MPDFTTCVRALPLAGAIIAMPGAIVLLAASWAGLTAPLAAGLALAVLVLSTGAFHEDGLADTADGFGGGTTRERKLEIMRDSRIGTYGGAALVLSLGLRWMAMATLAGAYNAWVSACAMISIAGLSRTLALWILFALPPARKEGVGAGAGAPTSSTMIFAGILAVLLFLPLAATDIGEQRILAALVLAALAVGALTKLSDRQIGGQTGDVAGAAQQIAEILALLALCAHARL